MLGIMKNEHITYDELVAISTCISQKLVTSVESAEETIRLMSLLGDLRLEIEERNTPPGCEVKIVDAGPARIAVIKELRKLTPQLFLKDAKDMTEKLPKTVLKDASLAVARAWVAALEYQGAKCELIAPPDRSTIHEITDYDS
jgi:ribosomal protein L7/L12